MTRLPHPQRADLFTRELIQGSGHGRACADSITDQADYQTQPILTEGIQKLYSLLHFLCVAIVEVANKNYGFR